MEDPGEALSNGDHVDPNLKVIKHPSYQFSSLSSFPWFDVRVFYVRISNFMVDALTPECLTLIHIPLELDSLIEVNGIRCSIDTEGVSSVLRRDRLDRKTEEATYVSTDSIRLNGSVKFQVFDKDYIVLSGVLEMSKSNGFVGELKNSTSRRWHMHCESVMSAGTGFFKGKQNGCPESLSPTVDVYVAGSFLGTPIILTKSLQLGFRRKQNWKGMLDSIPEYDTNESRKEVLPSLDVQRPENQRYKSESEEEYDVYWRRTDYVEYEDGELSWFNAGVRVGVGIGLGVCVGIGIGVGLLVRTYQATTRNFKRRLW